MALQVGCPLIKDTHNQGISNIMPSASGSTFNTSGKIGSGALNSDNEFSVTIPALSGKKAGSFCFGGYVVSSTITGDGTQIARINDGSSNLRIEVCPKTSYNGIYCYYVCNNEENVISNGDISSPNGGYYDQWAHFCLTSNGTTISKYMNGVLIGTCPYNGDGAITGTFVLTNNHKIYKNDLRVYDHCLSIRELKAISSALVLHYPLNDAYIEETSNLFSANLTYYTYGNNSGSATGNLDDTTIPKINNEVIYSISRTDTGNSAIGCGKCNLVAGKTYTASVYVYLSGNTDSNIFYIRSVNTDVVDLKYNNDVNPQNGPQNQGIRATATFTTSIAYNNCYICTYLNNANSKRALTCWQIEEKDHATPYTPNIRSETTVYDCSGYQNNGTISGSLSCSADSPRYKTCIETNASQIINTPIGNGIPSSDLTVACGIKRPETIDSDTMRCGLIAPTGNDQRFYYRILPQNNTAIFNIGFGVYTYGTKEIDATGHHLAATTSSDGKTISIYIDGILTNTGTEANAFNLAGNLELATNFIGKMSDFRFYRTALSADDIKELYNTSAYVSDNGTLLTYSAEE